MTANPDESWQVSFVDREEQFRRIRSWARRAAAVGKSAEFLASLREINEKLQHEPLSWGEVLYRLPDLGAVVLHRVCSLLHVSYAVHEESRSVWVRRIQPAPFAGLDEGTESQP